MDDQELKRCHEEVHRLETENNRLRQSAEAFGQLAERLNGELNAERRQQTADRRLTARGSPDRRTR